MGGEMMLSDRRFRIEKYIDMARITKNESEVYRFLRMAEHHLETEDEINVAPYDKTSSENFILESEVESFIDRTPADCYQEYKKYCIEGGMRIETQVMFGRNLSKIYGIKSKRARVNGELTKVYKPKEEF